MAIEVLLNSKSVVTPLRPVWYTYVTLSIPLGNRNIDAFTLALAMSFAVRLDINLYNVFNRPAKTGRSIQEDQLDLFQQIESNIATLGVDGHACVLRFICEMQTNRFSSSSIFGEIFNLMFTPKQGSNYKILEDYIAAEMAGQDSGPGQTCAETYPSCPVSVFAVLRRFQNQMGFSTPEDKPLNASINLQNSLLTGDVDP
nr:uncharacterized protein LOC123763415 isoform X1 [Procambarus clarkii]